MKRLKVLLSANMLLLMACQSSKMYRTNTGSYEDDVAPIQNILLMIQENTGNNVTYPKFEAYLQEELMNRRVAIHFFYVRPSDSLVEQKVRDSVLKYNFDFIIKETSRKVYDNTNTNIITQGPSNYSPYSRVPLFGPTFSYSADMHFLGYRKKQRYEYVWKASCEGMRISLFKSSSKKAGECLLNSLIAQKLIPEKPLAE
jgi:hypothetical protein